MKYGVKYSKEAFSKLSFLNNKTVKRILDNGKN